GSEQVEKRFDVVKIEGSFAVHLDVGLGVEMRAEGPGFVAAEVEIFDRTTAREDICNHSSDQVASAGCQRVQDVASVGDFAQALVVIGAQGRFHMAQRLHERNDLDTEFKCATMKLADLLRRVSGFSSETVIDLPWERIFPLD